MAGVSKDEADASRVAANILRFLEQSDQPKTEKMIDDAVEGSTKLLRDTLRQMVADKKIKRQIVPKEQGEGAGTRTCIPLYLGQHGSFDHA